MYDTLPPHTHTGLLQCEGHLSKHKKLGCEDLSPPNHWQNSFNWKKNHNNDKFNFKFVTILHAFIYFLCNFHYLCIRRHLLWFCGVKKKKRDCDVCRIRNILMMDKFENRSLKKKTLNAIIDWFINSFCFQTINLIWIFFLLRFCVFIFFL